MQRIYSANRCIKKSLLSWELVPQVQRGDSGSKFGQNGICSDSGIILS